MASNDTNNPHESALVSATISGWGMAYAYTVLFNAVLTVLKELTPPLLAVMKSLGHHWVTQGALDIIVFVVLGILLTNTGKQLDGSKLASWIVGTTVLGGLIIFGFYLIEL
jgi:hypothetical protein